MTESLSPTILSSISNLFNYSNLQTVLLDIVKTVESLSRDVASVKASVFQLGEDKVSKGEFSVFVGAMAGLQTKCDALDSRCSKACEDAASAQAARREMDAQLEKLRYQISDLEGKINKTRIASFSAPTTAPIDPEEIRKIHVLLAQKVDIDTFRDFREQMLKGEQNNSNLKKSIQDALDALNAKAAAAEKYENEMRLRQQQFFDTLKTYNDKLLHLESLKELLDSKVDQAEFNEKFKNLELRFGQDLSEKEEKLRELYNTLRKKADITQLMELEQILGAVMHNEDNGTAAGRTHVKCLSCDRVYNNLSGTTIDVGNAQLRKSTTSPSNTGRKMMVVGTDGLVYQGRDIVTPAPASFDVDVDITPPATARNRPPSPMTSSARRVRPQSAKRF